MRAARISDRPIDPPEVDLTDIQEEMATALEERKRDAYEGYMREVWTGRGQFWRGCLRRGNDYPEYDNEQQTPIFNAVRAAYAAIGLDDAQRAALMWRLVNAAVAQEGGIYAAWMSEAVE